MGRLIDVLRYLLEFVGADSLSGFVRIRTVKQTKTDVRSEYPAFGREEQSLRSTAGTSSRFVF